MKITEMKFFYITILTIIFLLLVNSTGYAQTKNIDFDTTIYISKKLIVIGKNKKYGLANNKSKELLVPIEYEYIIRKHPVNGNNYVEFFNVYGDFIYINDEGKKMEKEDFYSDLQLNGYGESKKINENSNFNNNALPKIRPAVVQPPLNAVSGQPDFLGYTNQTMKPKIPIFNTLDPINIENKKKNTKYPNIIVSQQGVWASIIYKIKNSDKWTEFFTDLGPGVQVRLLDIDKKGEKELIVEGYTYAPTIHPASDGEILTKRNTMQIFRIDSIPTQLLCIVTSCKDTIFSTSSVGEIPTSKFSKSKYKRTVTISQNKLVIGEPLLNNKPFKDKNNNDIPSGTYVLSNGVFKGEIENTAIKTCFVKQA